MKGKAGAVFSAFGLTQLVVVVAVGAALFFAYDPWRWSKVREEILRIYPGADHIDGASLERWMGAGTSNPTIKPPVLLDVRSAAEFAVSHLPNARNVSVADSPEAMKILSGIESRETDMRNPIVIYCEVGTASAEVADRLKRDGFERVQMLDGGVFQWANEMRPLVDGNGAAVSVVHPGGSPYSGLLKRSQRAATR